MKYSAETVTETRIKCKAHNPITESLLHEVCKYVYYDTLGCFARDLQVSRVEYVKITAPNMFYVNEQIYQVGSIRNMCYPIYFQYIMTWYSLWLLCLTLRHYYRFQFMLASKQNFEIYYFRYYIFGSKVFHWTSQ